MGIFVDGYISNGVSQDEWEKAYEETLPLLKKFNFMEIKSVKKFGLDLYCGFHTKERELYEGEMGWCAEGDSLSMCRAEEQCLYRKLDERRGESDVNIYDPLIYLLADSGFDSVKDLESNYYYFFGNKTQGEPYHIGLLGIACLLEDRLNGGVVCGGDITYGQCVKAVEKVNKYVKNPIKLPVRCRMDDLYERIKKLPIKSCERLDAFERLYLGKKNKEYFAFVEKNFTASEKNGFLKEKLGDSRIGTIGFADNLTKLLNYGFSIKKICEVVKESEPEKKVGVTGKDEKKENPYEILVREILGTKIYMENKDMRDCLHIDEDEKAPYSVATLFAQFAFMGAKNRSVEKFIPIEELEKQISSVLDDKCDVKKIISDYLNKEKERTEESPQKILNDTIDKGTSAQKEDHDNYDIEKHYHLPFFEKGYTISPKLEKILKSYIPFYRGVTNEDDYKQLLLSDWKEKCKFLIEQNRYLRLMKKSWDRIFENIKNNPESFERYYPMVRVGFNDYRVHDVVRAYVENDDFYEFCKDF